MSAVRFTNRAEFLAELARDVEQVNRRIVRLAVRTAPAGNRLPIQNLSIIAGYEVLGQVVSLEEPVGPYWGPEFRKLGESDAADRANAGVADLHRALADLGLDVRGGAFVEADG